MGLRSALISSAIWGLAAVTSSDSSFTFDSISFNFEGEDCYAASGSPTAAFDVAFVPEPASWVFLILGLAATGLAVRRRTASGLRS